MTDDLISRRDAIDELTKFFCDNDVIRGDFPHCERNERKATVLLENVRSIDAEPVIRCKDCVNCGTDDCAMHFEIDDKVYRWNRADDFCSLGERKEE